MKRNCRNFLDSYLEYAKDNFCPENYHLWTGLSLISGALERKVWLADGKIFHHPNTFILLVGHPGIGKSTAIARGVPFIERLRAKKNAEFKIMSGLMTQAGLMTEMNNISAFMHAGEWVQYSSGYYHASEASDSGLQNLHGDFNATVTALYDCADTYRKRLKNEEFDIPNPSLSILAGSTFDFLKNLVNQNSVFGGLASRFLYVISEERKLATPAWLKPDEETRSDTKLREALYEDLVQIHSLTGEFKREKAVADIYGGWWAKHEEQYNALTSEKMESILTRKPTALKKVAMLLSAAERDDLVITGDHMRRAIELVDEVTKDNAVILSSAIIGNKNTQESINHFMLRTIEKNGGTMKIKDLRSAFITYGGDLSKFDSTVTFLHQSDIVAGVSDDPGRVKLLVDPDHYL